MSRELWQRLPSEYRAGETPDELIIVWRGDKIGREATGIYCKLAADANAEAIVETAITEPSGIEELVRRHCSEGSDGSPFISLTDRLELARRYARGRDGALYEITVPAHRLVVDKPGLSETPLIEALAVGEIKPEEITAVRIGVDPKTNEIIWDRSQSWAQGEDTSSS